jgi:serine protease Do
MTWNSARLLKVAGLGVGILGSIALFVIITPVVSGQTVTRQGGLSLADWKQQIVGGTSVGVGVRDVDEADIKREKLQGGMGAVVEDVHSDSPAAKAGMKAGDIIVSFDGERVRSARHFERLVTETPAGRTVEATVMRAGSRVNLKLIVATVDPWEPLKTYGYALKPEAWTMAMKPEAWTIKPEAWTTTMPKLEAFYSSNLGPQFGFYGRSRLGVGVQNLTEQLGEYFGTAQGALVTAVDDNTPAKVAGLKAGDVITKINGEAVRDTADLRRKLSAAKGETTITVMRDRKELTLKAKIED